jgi:hypothetical protein
MKKNIKSYNPLKIVSTKIMIRYSKKDLKELLNMSKEGSPIYELLLESNCNTDKFKNFLLKLPNHVEYHYVFELPFKDIPKFINDHRVKNYCLWRWSIQK